MSIGVLLVDDHAMVRDGLKTLIEIQADLRVIGEATNGRDAVSTAAELRPDVVVMDISMPDMNGVEAARRIHVARPETRIVMLSMHGNAEHVYRALEAGATGYLLKESAGNELVAAIRAVHAGRRYLTEKVNELVIAGYLGERRAASPLESLSKRERDILQHVADGRGNKDIARLLNISVKTVETYRSRMLQKLGIRSVAELVKFAISHGLTQAK
jgi:DNA-binding NarL/FixJ family response regulator